MIKRFILIVGFLCLILAGASDAVEEGWRERKSNHFIIYYKDAPEDFIDTVESSAENYYQEITDSLGFNRMSPWSWEDRAKIYIYDDLEDYKSSAEQSHWSAGVTILGSKIIRTFPAAHGFFDSVLPHELGHIIFREYVGFKSDIPIWVDEGVAMYQEKARRFGAGKAVRQFMEQDRFIPLDDLSHTTLTPASDQATVEVYYAEAASAIYYLISEYGDFKFRNFCDYLREGLKFNEALKRAYFQFGSVKELNRAWMDHLERE